MTFSFKKLFFDCSNERQPDELLTVWEVAEETGISIGLCHSFNRRFSSTSGLNKVCARAVD
jgi:putative aminopeptidase FrvX